MSRTIVTSLEQCILLNSSIIWDSSIFIFISRVLIAFPFERIYDFLNIFISSFSLYFQRFSSAFSKNFSQVFQNFFFIFLQRFFFYFDLKAVKMMHLVVFLCNECVGGGGGDLHKEGDALEKTKKMKNKPDENTENNPIFFIYQRT